MNLLIIYAKKNIIYATFSWKRHKNFNYQFYDNKRCSLFMKENFFPEIYRAYNRLPLGIMKTYLWRYCIIYKYGGIYADSDTVSLTNNLDFLVDRSAHLVLTSENDVHFCQWVFVAPPIVLF